MSHITHKRKWPLTGVTFILWCTATCSMKVAKQQKFVFGMSPSSQPWSMTLKISVKGGRKKYRTAHLRYVLVNVV